MISIKRDQSGLRGERERDALARRADQTWPDLLARRPASSYDRRDVRQLFYRLVAAQCLPNTTTPTRRFETYRRSAPRRPFGALTVADDSPLQTFPSAEPPPVAAETYRRDMRRQTRLISASKAGIVAQLQSGSAISRRLALGGARRRPMG